MNKPIALDTIASQIPSHILESNPRFYDFLAAYYEWTTQSGNAKERISNHTDYLSFEKSLDEYTNAMKNEYLSDIPEKALIDKELFIKWSRKFNLARGSHASYKFLFKLLFNEQTTSIYLPKENILKTSDGVWISGESTLYVTHSADNLNQFQFQRISQERPIYEDIVERAVASVQRVRTKYIGRYVVTELTVSNIVGEFKEGFPIKTEAGAEEWIIPTGNTVDILDGGSGHFNGQRLFIEGMDDNNVSRNTEQNGLFDIRITTFFNESDISVLINGNPPSSFKFDGRFLSSADIIEGDLISVTFPAYQGYIVVDSINELQQIEAINILDLPIATPTEYTVTPSNGSTFEGTLTFGLVKSLKGYYQGTRGQLSSNMYLQDSYFYQNYSYAIRTEQDFSAYADIVKRVLHPSGFVLFGQLSYINIVELLLAYQDDIEIPPTTLNTLHKYGLGGNYRFVTRFKDKASIRLYKQSNFDSLDQDYLNGEVGYDLESKFLSDRIVDYSYNDIKGWMSKFNWADYYLYIPEDYSDVLDSGNLYFETGYVSTRTV